MLIGAVILSLLGYYYMVHGFIGAYLGCALIGGVWSLIALVKKGYGLGWSLLVWIFLGWEVIAFFMFIGTLTLFVVAVLPDRKRYSRVVVEKLGKI